MIQTNHDSSTSKNEIQRKTSKIQIHNDWLPLLQNEFEKDYMQNLKSFLKEELAAKKTIYPPSQQVFRALNECDFKNVKMVILGQDPYHGPGQAHGLCFSVNEGVKPPPSLVNIYKELNRDLGLPIRKSGDLSHWAQQGVLLLNATLTVEAEKAGSHQGKGWEQFTDEIIRQLNEKKENLVFLLWGSYAQKKGALIDRKKHLVLESVHPSPLSAHRGFIGCGHFSKANTYLEAKGLGKIEF